MKIAHVIGSLDPDGGGPPKIAASIATGLAALGHDVRLVTTLFRERRDAIGELLSAIPDVDKLSIVELEEVSPLRQLALRTPNPRLREHIEWAQVVHIHNVWCPINLAVAHLARSIGKPYFILLNGMLDPWTLTQKPYKKRFFLKLRYREMLENAAGLHLGNRDEKRLIEPLGILTPNVIIPNGVYAQQVQRPESFEPVYEKYPLLKDRPFMLFMGRLHYKKGLDITAEAFAQFAKLNDNVHLVVAGPEGGAGQDLRLRIQRHGIEDRVHIIGPVYGEIKWQLLHAADCFVLTTRQEGFSVAVTEALGCGLPCIVSQDCHYPEVAEANCGYVVPLEIEAAANAMKEMFSPVTDREQMSLNAIDLVMSQYTWPHIAEQCVQAYLDVI